MLVNPISGNRILRMLSTLGLLFVCSSVQAVAVGTSPRSIAVDAARAQALFEMGSGTEIRLRAQLGDGGTVRWMRSSRVRR